MNQPVRFNIVNEGTFETLMRQEVKILCKYELCQQTMPGILFIKNGWTKTNERVISKHELHTRLRIIMAAAKN
jgi:hypothetical protein